MTTLFVILSEAKDPSVRHGSVDPRGSFVALRMTLREFDLL
jgi:hypothetical protein